jgi:competence protein ComEC
VAPYPSEEPIEDANQISVVTRLIFGERSFLFAGDAEIDLEERMVALNRNLSADVLKVAHHGSKTSTSAAFLRAVSPKYAVITCGRNDYGHPNAEVVTRLVAANAQIYRTDVCGDIVFVSDGSNLSVKTQKGEEELRTLLAATGCSENHFLEPLYIQRFFFCA